MQAGNHTIERQVIQPIQIPSASKAASADSKPAHKPSEEDALEVEQRLLGGCSNAAPFFATRLSGTLRRRPSARAIGRGGKMAGS
jgi:hypothetical protein